MLFLPPVPDIRNTAPRTGARFITSSRPSFDTSDRSAGAVGDHGSVLEQLRKTGDPQGPGSYLAKYTAAADGILSLAPEPRRRGNHRFKADSQMSVATTFAVTRAEASCANPLDDRGSMAV